MAILTYFDSFIEDIAEGVHNLGSDQITVALTSAGFAPVGATDSELTHLTQISYVNLVGLRDVTTTSSAQTGGQYKLVLADLTLTAAGGAIGPFQYIVLYNETSTGNKLIAFSDNSAEYTIADGDSFVINFDEVNGAITLAAV